MYICTTKLINNNLKLKTMTNSQLIHEYATQNRSNRTSGNLFYNNGKIYSYGHHYLLGNIIEPNIIIINNSGYSNSTAKHINLLNRATSHYTQYYTKNIDSHLVLRQLRGLQNLINVAKAKKINYKIEAINLFNSYTEFNKLKLTFEYFTNICDIAIKALINELFGTLELSSLLSELMAQNSQNALIKVKKAQKTEEAQIEEFHNFKRMRVNFNYSYLRFNGVDVETSQGLKINTMQAKFLYLAILANKNIIGSKIESFTVTSIDNNFLVVGCHTIPIEEVHNVGKLLI